VYLNPQSPLVSEKSSTLIFSQKFHEILSCTSKVKHRKLISAHKFEIQPRYYGKILQINVEPGAKSAILKKKVTPLSKHKAFTKDSSGIMIKIKSYMFKVKNFAVCNQNLLATFPG
jgi:hypothetical protein